jgi:glycosyltransferase involved in cell wall biosynthesis
MTNKPTLLIMAPVGTVSGYGARSRDIATAIIESDKYDVKIWPLRWGSTPMNALSIDNPKHKEILARILTEPNLPTQPEIFVQITVPNEFQKIGKYNIGITAGIETTICSHEWIEGCNRMDLVLTSSEHAKKVFEESVWDKLNEQTKQPEGSIKLTTPVEVLFEGVDLDIYKKLETSDLAELKSIKENFCFLYVGHWLQGDFGEDRKNTGLLVRTFLEAFKNKAPHNQPALILKTSSADFSPVDRDTILQKLRDIYKATPGKNLPSVYLLHGDLTDEEMNKLYNHPKVKAHVSLTKGEGYGRPLAEASISQKPVIVTNWSGHVDFMKHAVLLPGTLTNVHHSAVVPNMILAESQWFSVDAGYAVGVLKNVFDNYKDYTINAKKQGTLVKKEFNLEKMKEKLVSILETKVPEFPKQVALKLPTLKKIELPKLKKI